MATQYTSVLKLALPTQGELSGAWGNVVNDNITSMIEQAIAGLAVINTWSSNSHTLTSANGVTSESRCAMLSLVNAGSAPSAAASVICPALAKTYIVKNGCGQAATLKTASGSGIAVPNGKSMLLFCDGTNVVEAVDHVVTMSAGTLTITGLTTFASLKGADSTTVTGILDEDNMASNSAVKLATQQSIKAYVDSQVDTVDSLAEVLAQGNTSGGTDIALSTDDKVQFRDAAIHISSSADGQLDIVADTEIQIAATTVDINGAVALNGAITGATNITLSGELDAATGDFSGDLDVDGTTNLDIVDIDGATQIDATLSVGVDDTGYDVKFFGATSGKSLLWDESADSLIVTGTIDATTVEFDALSGTGSVTVTDILDEDNMASNSATVLATQQSIKAYVDAQVDTVDTLAEILAIGNTTTTDQKIQFRDTGIFINSSADGQLDIVADTEIQIAATTIDINGAINASGEIIAASLDISGAIDVAGTTNLDVVDIDGAVNIAANVTMASTNPVLDILADSGNDATLRLREAGTGVVGAEIIYDGGTNLLNFRVGNNSDLVRLSIARDAGNFVTTPTAGGHAVFNEGGIDADFRVESDGNANMLFVDGGNNRVGVGTGTPLSTLDVRGNTDVTGILTLSNNISDDSNKTATFISRQYDSGTETEGFLMMQTFANSSGNRIDIGGGTSQHNASSEINFFTAGNTTTRTGTNRLSIASSGAATFSAGATFGSAVTVEGPLAIRNATQSFFGGLSAEVNSGIINLGVNEGSGNRFGGAYTQANQGGMLHFDTRAGNPLFQLYGRTAGTANASGSILFQIDSTGNTVFNESGVDADFRVESNGNTHMLFVDGNADSGAGQVIIGSGTAINSVGAKLAVNGGANTRIAIDGTDSAGFYLSDSGAEGITIRNAGGNLEFYPVADHSVVFNESGIDSDFRIESNGNANMLFVDGGNNAVGIGTATTGNSTLEVRSTGVDGTFANAIGFQYSGNASEANTISTAVSSNAALSGMKFNISDGGGSAGKTNVATFLRNQIIFNDDSNDQDFRVESDTATHTLFVQGSNGRVGINESNPTAQLYVSTNAATTEPMGINDTGANGATAKHRLSLKYQTTEVGSIKSNNSATTFNTSSDQRLKENIADADDAGNKIDAIQVRQFDWKVDGSHQDYGMVAQELLEVAPEAVARGETQEEMMGVDYSKLVPMLIKEIQSLRARVADLES